MVVKPDRVFRTAGQKSTFTQKTYRFLSGVDNAEFCQPDSGALGDRYVLHGNPVMMMDKDMRIVGQTVIRSEIADRHTAPADYDQKNDPESILYSDKARSWWGQAFG